MKRFTLVASALAVFATSALAAEDPIAIRKALMQANGAGAGIAGGVLKGELEYSPTIGKASIAAMNAAAQAYSSFLPEGSDDDPRTSVSPKIWEDKVGFEALMEKFRAATSAAMEASGKDGPADAEAFAAAVKPVLGSCKGCHEDYRIKK